MSVVDPEVNAKLFGPLRAELVRLAYRMLGSVADAEDVVQEAFLRWSNVDPAEINEPRAFLRRIVMHLCIDHLKSARQWRETYIGPWLPEPVIQGVEEEVEDITLPLMIALERLSPLERAAFLLHDVFGLSFDEIAQTIGRGQEACRQLASRARTNVRAGRPRFPVQKERGLQIAEAFFNASRNGNIDQLRLLLAADVIVLADGGGKTAAPLRPVIGFDDAIRLHISLAAIFAKHVSQLVQYGYVNSLPGFVTVEADNMLQTTALEIHEERITGIYVTRNPEKLQHLRIGGLSKLPLN